jgi:hypothetical protein
MQRSMGLIREILLQMETHPDGNFGKIPNVEGFSAEQIGYHVYLMVDGGLVQGIDTTSINPASPSFIPTNISWQGHEFLDAVRDKNVWDRVSATAQAKGGSLSFEVLKALAVQMIKSGLGL